MERKVYADNAATTAMSRTAIEAMLPYLDGIYGNPSSLYSLGQQAKEALEGARADIAACLGAQANEIYFTSCGSESDNQAIRSAAHLGALKGKKHIISTAFEHHAVLHTLDRLKREEGFEVTLLDVHRGGVVRPEEVQAAIRPDTCLVTVMFANNEIGTVQPIAEIGAVCRAAGVTFHTDAVQAAGHIPVNVAEQNIDMLSISAHKFHGPKGVGALYCRRGVRLLPFIDGGAQERGRRAGTENVAGICAMAAALKEACANMNANAAKLTKLRDRIVAALTKIPHSKLNGDMTRHLPGTINMCFEGIEGEGLLLYLDDMGICASSGSACTSGSLDPSHVLLAIGLPHEVAHGSLRISLSEYNTEEDADHIIKCVPEVVEKLRAMSPVWKEMERGEKQHII
ncbi:MAG TPA: cysteine desulfurase NifS [Candidatus Coproplasma avistercoris]|nr:cysteine desulfurase NifS [Candidatus Coproplasma avistercoris]